MQAQSDQLEITKLTLEKSGKVTWSTLNEKKDTQMEIYERRYHSWQLIGKMRGKGVGANSYTFNADTSCMIYTVRITAIDDSVRHSNPVDYPNQKNIEVTSQDFTTTEQPLITLNYKTNFDVFDQYGNKVLSGCDNKVDTSKLPKGAYYFNFGDKHTEFFRK